MKNIFNNPLQKGLITLVSLLLTSCLYVVEQQQGNVLEPEKVRQIKIGNNQAEVLSLLGSPLLKHPFDEKQWIYVYQRIQGEKILEDKRLIIRFDQVGKIIQINTKNID